MDSRVNSAQTFEKELTPVLHRPVHKVQEEGTLPSSLLEVSITLIPKPKTSQGTKIIDQYLTNAESLKRVRTLANPKQ